MSGAMYANEDIGALVFDYGSNSIRAGYAGEELPKIDMPTASGVVRDADFDKQNLTYYFDTVSINVPRPNMEIVSPLKEGMIEDWDLFESQMDHICERLVKSACEYHPILMTEPAWNARNKREKLTEIMFEKYDVPAFFLVKNAVLSAFANGRSTGLILDSGSTITSAVPVYDGYVIQQGIVKSPLAGDFILNECRKLMDNMNIEVVPAFTVAEKEAVSEGMPAKWKKRPIDNNLTKSFQNFAIKETLKDFVYSTLQVSDMPYDESEIESMPAYVYEFPNGYNQVFTKERFGITEGLFDPSNIKDISDGSSMLSMSHIVSTSVGFCDIDIKASLYNNIVLVGGNSIYNGFTERLTRDLSAKVPPSMKLKIITSPMPAERRFSSWIGGSILASMGSFQQMWISKQEYEEGGKSCVEKKCP